MTTANSYKISQWREELNAALRQMGLSENKQRELARIIERELQVMDRLRRELQQCRQRGKLLEQVPGEHLRGHCGYRRGRAHRDGQRGFLRNYRPRRRTRPKACTCMSSTPTQTRPRPFS